MKDRSTTATEICAKIEIITRMQVKSLLASIEEMNGVLDSAPGVSFRSGRDTVEDRCNQYGAGLAGLNAMADLIEATESISGADLSDVKNKVKVAAQDLKDRRDALGCS